MIRTNIRQLFFETMEHRQKKYNEHLKKHKTIIHQNIDTSAKKGDSNLY